MTLQPRHIAYAALLHVILFAALVLTGVQCSQHVQPVQVMRGVILNPSQLQQFKPPTPTPAQTKPDQADQGPQQQVQADVVADQAKQQQEKAAAEKQQQEQQAQQAAKAAEEQKLKDEEAKAKAAEELHQVQEAQKQAAEQAAAQKKQQEAAAQAKAQADAAAAAQKAQEQKDKEEQLRKEAQEQQEAQQAMLNQKKKAEEARQAADRRQREKELQAALGVASSQLTAEVQSQWATQLVAALANAWARPPGTDSSLKAFVLMTLAPNGQVQSATIDTSSGVPAFDDSVVRAAYAASPMPLPADSTAFRSKVDVCFSPNPRNCE
jgi:colicin import membrane protein